jgi:hypothetical protein
VTLILTLCRADTDTDVNAVDIRALARQSVESLKKDSVVVETKKFAGKSVE